MTWDGVACRVMWAVAELIETSTGSAASASSSWLVYCPAGGGGSMAAITSDSRGGSSVGLAPSGVSSA